jgi:glycosyltransferase involved in cell wall biosynthesis
MHGVRSSNNYFPHYGHVDIIGSDNCYSLDDQRQTSRGFADFDGVDGWGESQVDEAVERLEQVFSNPEKAAQRGRRAAEDMARFTWQATAEKIKAIIMEFS